MTFNEDVNHVNGVLKYSIITMEGMNLKQTVRNESLILNSLNKKIPGESLKGFEINLEVKDYRLHPHCPGADLAFFQGGWGGGLTQTVEHPSIFAIDKPILIWTPVEYL